MDRRTCLLTAGTLSVTALAGCFADGNEDPGSSEGDTSDTDEHEALAVVDAYFEAIDDHDPEAMADVMHTYHPFDPARLDEDGEGGFSVEPIDIDDYEREIVDEEFDTETIRDDPTIAFWFRETDATLDETLDGEEAVLARATYATTEDGETVEETERFIVLTEDGDWKVFFPYEEPPAVPDDDPVDDEEYRLVDEIEYDTETRMATIHVSGAGDVKAEELIAYSSGVGDDSSVWSDGSETLPSLDFFTVPFDPDGDEIVVTLLLDDGEEIVIHREEYVP